MSLMIDHTAAAPLSAETPRATEPEPDNIRALVDAFYLKVREDALLGPVFDAKLAGRWDQHLPKMVSFWSSLVLGTKAYRGNVQAAHSPLEGLAPEHFARWLSLFLKTVDERYAPAAAVQFMAPALRIAQSLQLSQFGWDYEIPAEQRELLAALTGKPVEATRPRGEPFPTPIVGAPQD
jgi:hemoglobin